MNIIEQLVKDYEVSEDRAKELLEKHQAIVNSGISFYDIVDEIAQAECLEERED
jgi:hypothetical protein